MMQWRLTVAVLVASMCASGASAQQQSNIIVDYCTPGPYIVFFDWGSAALDRNSRAILDNAYSNYLLCGPARIRIEGYTDTSELPRISRARAQAVRRYLSAKGAKRRWLGLHANGAMELRKRTEPGVQERENRRVEITFGPLN